MPLSSNMITRKTRSTNIITKPIDESSTISNEFHQNLNSPVEFINLYNKYNQIESCRSIIINIFSNILTLENVEKKILLFIIDCLIVNYQYLSDTQFKQDLLPLIKRILIHNNNDIDLLLPIIKFLIVLVEHRSNILTLTLSECLSCLLNFLVQNLSSTTYTIFGDLINELLSKIIKQFLPLSKDIVDIILRSLSTIISNDFLQQLKLWINNTDDLRLALFTIQLWESLVALLSRLIIRGHNKGNELLAVIEDAFTVSNYSIRSAAFLAWSSFMLHINKTEDIDSLQIHNRLLKLYLTPFQSDSTSKSKSASISKCQAWLTLITLYPKNLHDVILPFLSFAFGNQLTSKINSTTTAWWPECRQIGGNFLYELLTNNIHCEYILQSAGDEILNYLFDSIVDQLLEYKIDSIQNEDKSLWLISWNSYLNHLMNIFKSNNSSNDNQRVAINTCLLTRIEQLWIDSRIETRFLLKLFETFEQINFPLAVETVLCDSSIRTKTLSAAQIHPSSGNYKSQDKYLSYCTTLSDQYLHMMLEHAIRLNDEDQTIEDAYLHVISYLIDTLSKTSDENFCYQTSSLLTKCSVELSHQPLLIPTLFWHIWYRCSTHLINILNRCHTFELNNKNDNQKQEVSIELLLRPFSFNDIQRLDYSYTLLWIQLFKALCRLVHINNDQTKYFLLNLIVELVRNEPAFEQAIYDQHNQRLLGFILIIIKTILKTFSEIDLTIILDRSNNNFTGLFSTINKRSSPLSLITLFFTQISIIINHVLQRLVVNNENSTQFILVNYCLVKSAKHSLNDQSKLIVLTNIRDIIIDLLNLCKTYPNLEIVLKNLIQLIPFIQFYEQMTNPNLTVGLSPISINKHQTDNMIINKFLTIITSVFEPTTSSSLLQLIYPFLMYTFQHNKTIIRTKTRKCWNETFGKLKFIVYPDQLRICLRDLKEKEHLLLPCFLADHDNSNTAGSGIIPSSNDESQLSQQIDIATPLISAAALNQQLSKTLSPARCLPASSMRPANINKNETVFVPIINKTQSDSPISVGKRLSHKSSCLTESQKEKLRSRHAIPLLCEDSCNTQSNSFTTEQTSNSDFNLKTKLVTNLSLFNQSIPNTSNETKVDSTIEITKTNDDNNNSENETELLTEQKLSYISRSSICVRKNLMEKQNKDQSITLSEEVVSTNNADNVNTNLKKSILKRLSPTRPRQYSKRRVSFHDQVKVLVFASPSHRDSLLQQKKKFNSKDDMKSPTRIIPKENLPLRKQPMSTRRLSAMNNTGQIPPSPSLPTNVNKIRSSKLFHPNDALADWSQNKNTSEITCLSDPIFPNLIDCDKPIDGLLQLLFNGECPIETVNYFQSKNINSVGDFARLTGNDIETYPLPSPKLTNIQKSFLTYQEHLRISTAATDDAAQPIASTSEDMIPMNDAISSISITNNATSKDKLYDVDMLMDNLDYDKLHLNDQNSLSTMTKNDVDNDKSLTSPKKRCLSSLNYENKSECMSPKKHIVQDSTLGDRLQMAANLFKEKGSLPFDDNYVELVRQLVHNSSLTHLEQLHLKKLFFAR